MIQIRQAMATIASVTEAQVNESDSKDYYKFVPWDNPDNVITFKTYATMDNIFLCYLNPLIFIIGVPANVLSCVVFFRQGSGSSVVFIISITFVCCRVLSRLFSVFGE